MTKEVPLQMTSTELLRLIAAWDGEITINDPQDAWNLIVLGNQVSLFPEQCCSKIIEKLNNLDVSFKDDLNEALEFVEMFEIMEVPQSLKDALGSFLVKAFLNLNADDFNGSRYLNAIKNLSPETLELSKINLNKFNELVTVCPNLKKLSLKDSLLNEEFAKSIADKFTHLLDLSRTSKFTDKTIEVITNKLTELQYLNVFGCCKNLTDVAVDGIVNHLKHLTHLILNGIADLKDEAIKKIAEKLTYLQHLDLGGCGNLTDVAVKAIADNLVQLRYLNLNMCKVTDEAIEKVTDKLIYLQYLNLAFCSQLTDKAIITIAKLKHLQSLDLSGCNLNNLSIKAIVDNLTQLKYFDLCSCRKLTDEAVIMIADKLTVLKHINLSDCTNLTAESIKKLQREERVVFF